MICGTKERHCKFTEAFAGTHWIPLFWPDNIFLSKRAHMTLGKGEFWRSPSFFKQMPGNCLTISVVFITWTAVNPFFKWLGQKRKNFLYIKFSHWNHFFADAGCQAESTGVDWYILEAQLIFLPMSFQMIEMGYNRVDCSTLPKDKRRRTLKFLIKASQ